MRAREGFGALGKHVRIAHRFDPTTPDDILGFHTAERTQRFVKDLQDTELMSAGELPPPHASAALQQRQEGFRAS